MVEPGRRCLGDRYDLQQLIALDAAYAGQGRPTTNAAKAWREKHPEYDALLARLLDFQQHGLGHARWGKSQSLADYYRRTGRGPGEGGGWCRDLGGGWGWSGEGRRRGGLGEAAGYPPEAEGG